MQILFPAEKKFMKPIVLYDFEILGGINHFLILFGFESCNCLNGPKEMEVLCIAPLKRLFLHGNDQYVDFNKKQYK